MNGCTKNKALLSVGLAGLGLLPLLLLLCLQLVQYGLKQTPQARLGSTRLHTLVLPEAAVRWEKKGRELKLADHYFDVTHLERRGELLHITGHYDDLETSIALFLKQALHHSRQQATWSRLILMLQCLVALPLFSFSFLALFPRQRFCKIKSVFYSSPCIPLRPLPPRAV